MFPTESTLADEIALPRIAGGFRLLKELGRGGMGVVYEAEERSTGRHVALKVLTSQLRGSKEALARFHREARLAASISDPHCVFVYGAHEVDGSPAISMELMSGATLEDRLKQGEPIPIDTAIRWTLDVIAGLQAAQAAGVLHRDVKPSNCFLTFDGRVKIGDFGISRLLEPSTNLTISGQFLGTPVFASPEQVRGEKVDSRSDLYSVGATLYALLTGQRPFRAVALGALLTQVSTQQPMPPRSVRPEIPRGLERVVQRAMHKNPAKRYEDYDSFKEALSRFAPSSQVSGSLGARLIAFLADCTVVSTLAAFSAAPISIREDGGEPVLAVIRSALESVGLSPKVFIDLLLMFWMIVYFVAGEALTGTTIGKWFLGLSVVQGADLKPSFLRATTRAVTLLVPVTFLAAYLRLVSDQASLLLGNWLWSFLALAPLVLSTIRRATRHRLLHDLVSGTRVVRDRKLFNFIGLSGRLPARTSVKPAPCFPASLGRYQVEGEVGVSPTGTMLRARDPRLERTVWIHVRTGEGGTAPPAGPGLDRGIRLHRIEEFADSGHRCQVYEDPGGLGLLEYRVAENVISWPLMSRTLVSLVEEIEVQGLPARVEGGSGASACLEQLWLDRSLNLRVLDEPLSINPSRSVPPLQLIHDAAQAMVTGRGPEHGCVRVPEQVVLPAPPPTRAQRAIQVLVASALGAVLISSVLLIVSATKRAIPAVVAGVLCFTVSAVMFRGGVSLSWCGIGVYTRSGRRASRFLTTYRSAFGWGIPLVAFVIACGVSFPSGRVASEESSGDAPALIALILTLLAVGTLGLAMCNPSRGFQDYLAGTLLLKSGKWEEGERDRPRVSEAELAFPPDIPGYAEPTVRRLLMDGRPFESVAAFRESIQAWKDRPASLTRRVRAFQMAAGIVALTAVSMLIALASGGPNTQEQLAALVAELKSNDARDRDGPNLVLPGLSEDAIRAREILIAELSASRAGEQAIANLDADQVRRLRDAVDRHPTPTRADVRWAWRELQAVSASQPEKGDSDAGVKYFQLAILIWMVGLIWSALAFAFRGGPSFTALGVLVRSKRANRASRLRCSLRSLLIWSPFAALFTVAAALSSASFPSLSKLVMALTAFLVAGAVFYAWWFPSRSLQDRLIGTWLVPR